MKAQPTGCAFSFNFSPVKLQVDFQVGVGFYSLPRTARKIAGQYERAVEMIETAMTMVPDNSGIADMAVYGYQQLGMNEPALVAFRRAVELDPSNGWA